MALKGKSSYSDWEFIRAARVEQRECEQAHDVAWEISLRMDNERSVIGIKMCAWEVGPDLVDRRLACYETSWPNARVQTFPACLFQAAVSLTRLVEDSRRDELLETAKRQ
jgi:hypothetical protein